MQRSQFISVLTGIIAVVLGLGYLILVQVLDWRGGEMLPAPVDLSYGHLWSSVLLSLLSP
jgi:hypothetical protein